jgi:hypothetical protein
LPSFDGWLPMFGLCFDPSQAKNSYLSKLLVEKRR